MRTRSGDFCRCIGCVAGESLVVAVRVPDHQAAALYASLKFVSLQFFGTRTMVIDLLIVPGGITPIGLQTTIMHSSILASTITL